MPSAWTRMLIASCLWAMAIAPARPVLAAGGVVEIDQARARAGGVTPGDGAGFPVVLSVAGSYRLTSDLVVPTASASAIAISAAEGATLDLGGFALRGPVVCSGSGAGLSCAPAGSGSGVSSSAAGVMVRNGRIEGMGGVGIGLGAYARIEDVQVRGCGGIGISCGSGCRILRSTSSFNGSNGIFAGEGSLVAETQVRGNKGHGILSNQSATLLRQALSAENAFLGLASFSGGLMLESVSRANGTFGLSLGAGSESGYAHVLSAGNGSGAVTGGLNLGGNLCDLAACP